MSYNTRRSGGFGGGSPQQQQQNLGNIGQRRPVVTNNFVPGGQLNQNKPGNQMQQQRPPHPQQQPQNQPPANTNTNINFRSQQISSNQGYQTTQSQPAAPMQQVKPEPPSPIQAKPTVAQVPGINPPNPLIDNSNGEQMDQDNTEEGAPKKKPFWDKTGNKISKKEKMRRRNVRLSKILQPKNAVMILNELVANTCYIVDEVAGKSDGNQFRASVLVEGVNHVGVGRSKIQAKNAAAETALKYLIKSNKLAEMKKDEEGNEEKMDVSEDDSQAPLPWQHVASFALFKLFCSWGEDPNIVKGIKGVGQLNSSVGSDKQQHENKPAKSMPANPETMNPLMLINQMLPQAQFEEIGKSGNSPNVTYSYRCNVGEQSFIGTGPNKKAAKKLAAFGACHKILNVNYPTDVYVPIF